MLCCLKNQPVYYSLGGTIQVFVFECRNVRVTILRSLPCIWYISRGINLVSTNAVPQQPPHELKKG